MPEKKSVSDARIEMIEKQLRSDKDPAWEQMEPVYLMRDKNTGPSQFVAINGRSYLVKRGEQVMVPKPVAEVLKASMAADNERLNMILGLTNREI